MSSLTNTQFDTSLTSVLARLKLSEQLYGCPTRRLHEHLQERGGGKERVESTLEELHTGNSSESAWQRLSRQNNQRLLLSAVKRGKTAFSLQRLPSCNSGNLLHNSSTITNDRSSINHLDSFSADDLKLYVLDQDAVKTPSYAQTGRSQMGLTIHQQPNPSTPTTRSILSSTFTQEHELFARTEAERAIRDKKVFTVMGPYPSLRDSLRKRGWVEKFTERAPIVRNLTNKQYNESCNSNRQLDAVVYGIMSTIVRNTTPALLFSVKATDVGLKVTKTTQVVNHFGRSSTFTTKAGLSSNLRSVCWFESIDPSTFYPRCYSLDQVDEKNLFIDDYRLTACMAVIKRCIEKYEISASSKTATQTASSDGLKAHSYQDRSSRRAEGLTKLVTPFIEDTEGLSSLSIFTQTNNNSNSTPVRTDNYIHGNNISERIDHKHKLLSAKGLRFAMKRCQKYLTTCKHEDIDRASDDIVSESIWDQFIKAFFQFMNEDLELDKKAMCLLVSCKALMKRVESEWPQFRCDGHMNVWILKPGAKSRGRGIQCTNELSVILNAITNRDGSLVIQKYIERPLLIYKTKFDIRQWFLVTDWNPLTMWFYNDCYLRFCSQEYTLNSFHESIHISNNTVQKNFKPDSSRSRKLPRDNMWTSEEFIEYLSYNGYGEVWKEKIVPGMKQAIICSLLCTQEQIEHRKTAFELFGADFMLSEDLQPWLLEINSSPSMARTTAATKILVDAVLEDTIKVVLDRKEDKCCDTGQFELVYWQELVNEPPHIDSRLMIQGTRITRPPPPPPPPCKLTVINNAA